MATLNTSTNGQSIRSSYEKIVNGPAQSWAVFTVQAPLVSAFQQDSGKESILKVQTTGEGDLVDLVEEFSDGRIQFAFVKVKDPNSGLPKNALVAWCGEGVPERTKGYFTSHLNAVSKILHGYHVQVTARSDRDLTPEIIMQKVADSSGSKYSGGGSALTPSSSGPPPVASKPVMPTKSFGAAGGYSPLGTRSRQAAIQASSSDNDGWGSDAPQVSRSQLEKVDSAYKPTKVDMASLQSGHDASRQAPQRENGSPDVVRGGYQPIGKVDLNAIRSQASGQGRAQDDRPTVVKGAYEPTGKVDIAEIRRKAQAAPPHSAAPAPSQPSAGEDERPKSLADRSAAFQQSGERLTTLPKPQVANRFGSQASSFTGTKAPAPGGFEAKSSAPAAPVGTASRTFADQGGKTPAQQWEEKRRARGLSGAADTTAPGGPTSPIASQPSGGWQSQYEGKKWGVQLPSRTGGSGVSAQRTGQDEPPVQAQPEEEEEQQTSSGGIGSIRNRFKDAPPMGAAREAPSGAPEPPPLDNSSKPNAGVRGVAMPGLPSRLSEAGRPAEEHQDLPPPPPRPMPQDEPEEEEDEEPMPPGSPVRIAMPVAREAVPELTKADPLPPRAVPTASLAQAADSFPEPSPAPQVHEQDPARGAGIAAASEGPADVRASEQGGKTAIAQYDYEKAEDNELELREGERVTDIDMVDEDWWMGRNEKGEMGLFPSNYVELQEGGGSGAGAGMAARHEPEPEPEEEEIHAPLPAAPAGVAGSAGGKTALAQYDYEAAEDNELSFPDGAKITDIEFPDEDWWFGHFGGKSGLFPANYVTLD
ncbi:actin binding protein [Recurvomyces mirabilis]|uniref:Actin binding protein n=1 Tax=Recurvomyces mirabilis TaxID=574656 RepID=A0AAE0TS66_9PEZI|nr:actin binding protein [Recurvomyces mirabilis]KAK5150014.1 actin binding protein [Recurvomyces mirabilis]